MGNLVHHGKEEATIEVLLKNKGDGAFKHQQYGDVIRIVRRIKRTSGGGYVLSNDTTGVVISKSPQEVADLCAHFNIQVSNPCVIMTQVSATDASISHLV
jgi:chromosome segregation ATPase